MKNLVIIVVFGLMCGVCCASSQGDRYIDNILRSQLPNRIKSAYLDPGRLNNFTDYVQMPGYGQVLTNFSNGQFIGLSQVFRPNACLGPSYVGQNITLNCTIAFRNLKVIYNGRSRVAAHYSFNAIGNLTQPYIHVYLTSSRYANRPLLKTMEPFGFIAAPGRDSFQRSITDSLNRNVPQQLSYIIHIYFRNIFQQSIQNIPLPLP